MAYISQILKLEFLSMDRIHSQFYVAIIRIMFYNTSTNYFYVTKLYNIVMKYRSRTEIIAMLLGSLNTGSTKTRLMYNAFLSYAQLKEYLRYLEENELIKCDPSTRLYTLTDKGKQFLKVYHKISGLVPLK